LFGHKRSEDGVYNRAAALRGFGAEAKPALVRLQKSLGLTSNLMIVVSLWLLSGPDCEVLEHLSSLKRLPERGAVGWENIV
jgi:hypothetical protein